MHVGAGGLGLAVGLVAWTAAGPASGQGAGEDELSVEAFADALEAGAGRGPADSGLPGNTAGSGLLRVRAEGVAADLIQARPTRFADLGVLFAPDFALGEDARSDRTTALELSAQAGVRGHLGGPVWGRLGVDTGLLSFVALDLGGLDRQVEVLGDGRPIGTHASQTAFLGETYVDLQPDRNGVVRVRAGKLFADVGWGAIFTAYAFGVDADLNLRYLPRPAALRVRTFALLPDGRFTNDLKRSPLFGVELGWDPIPRFGVDLLGALWIDGDDGLAPVLSIGLNRSLVECPSCFGVPPALLLPEQALFLVDRTRGVLGWVGARARGKLSERAELRGFVLVGLGESRMDYRLELSSAEADGRATLGLLSVYAQLEAEAEAGPFDLSLFGLFASGDGDLGRGSGRFGGFATLAPLVPFTALFLAGTTAPLQQAPSLQTLSPFGAGLGAGGLRVAGYAGPWGAEVTGALFATPVAAPEPFRAERPQVASEHFVGGELDLSLFAGITRDLFAAADGAVFFPGPFFRDMPRSWQVVVSIGGGWGPTDL